MQGKAAYIRAKVVGPFPEPCASGNYVHRAALFDIQNLRNLGTVWMCILPWLMFNINVLAR
jgi:hypothetical protein